MIRDETRARIDAEIARFPRKRGALIEALRIVQEDLGHVGLDAAAAVAAIFEISIVEVMEVVSFYNMLYDAPHARHHVGVCTNLSCALRGSREMLRQLEAHLAIEVGGATPDGRIHLGHEECLGACAWAPMMRIDDEYHEDLDLESAKRIVDALD